MKKVRRRTIWTAYEEDWCSNCSRFVNMAYLSKKLISTQTECQECGTIYQINLMEGGNDLIQVPNHYKFMPNRKDKKNV